MSNLPDHSEESTDLMRLPTGGELVRLAESGLASVSEITEEASLDYWLEKVDSCRWVYCPEYSYGFEGWRDLDKVVYFLSKAISIGPRENWFYSVRGLAKLGLYCNATWYEDSECLPDAALIKKLSSEQLASVFSDLELALSIATSNNILDTRAELKSAVGDFQGALDDLSLITTSTRKEQFDETMLAGYFHRLEATYRKIASLKLLLGDANGANDAINRANLVATEKEEYYRLRQEEDGLPF